jgi:hypothetical protein
MGSDGMAPSQAKGSNFNPIRISFNKAEHLESSALRYAHQLKKMFEDIGIEVSEITKRKGNIRKDGTKTFKIVITMAKNINNTINFLEKIGYRYCERKEIEGSKWLSYLKTRKFLAETRSKLRNKAIEMQQSYKNMTMAEIARCLGVPKYDVKFWLKTNMRTEPPKSFPRFNEWIKKRFDDNLIFENIIERTNGREIEVYDIGVDKVHNFIANGFIVHNCHQFIPADQQTVASEPLLALIKEGREPGISMVLITQMPNKLHPDALAQCDLVISHRLTAKSDVLALRSVMQTYVLKDLQEILNSLPRDVGCAVVLDDNSERLYAVQIRPRLSWHAGGSLTAIPKKALFE